MSSVLIYSLNPIRLNSFSFPSNGSKGTNRNPGTLFSGNHTLSHRTLVLRDVHRWKLSLQSLVQTQLNSPLSLRFASTPETRQWEGLALVQIEADACLHQGLMRERTRSWTHCLWKQNEEHEQGVLLMLWIRIFHTLASPVSLTKANHARLLILKGTS